MRYSITNTGNFRPKIPFIRKVWGILLILGGIAYLAGCSPKTWAVQLISDSISSTGQSLVFTGEDDPELVRDSLPVILKMQESLLEQVRDNEGLYLNTGMGFIVYANAFVHEPALMLSDQDRRRQMLRRARKLYLRGRNYVIDGLRLRYPHIRQYLTIEGVSSLTGRLSKKDVPYIYWMCMGWMGAYSTDPFDMEVSATILVPLALMKRVLELDPGYQNGAVHEFFISFYGSAPAMMGGNLQRATEHFHKALRLSRGKRAAPYVLYAVTVAVKRQDRKLFRSLLRKALAVDTGKRTKDRLSNILAQRKARYYLQREKDLFL